jgi:hypothetical protein
MARVSRLILHGESEKAIRVSERDGQPVWLPKSQISYRKNYTVPAGHKECDIDIPDWLADKNNLSST